MINKETDFLSSLNEILNNHLKAVEVLLSICHPIAKDYLNTKIHSPKNKFNFFNVISDLYYKENFHSDIIAFLLDPNGNHGYKHLMLKTFIAMLNETGLKIDWQYYNDAVVVREEGKIDILIKSESNRRAIIIENKINNASDMHRQLPRYYDDISKKYTIDAIVYLPLDYNKSPDKEGWTEEDKKHVNPLLKIIPAYDNMRRLNLVEDWLQKSLQEIDNVDVFSFIRQYAKLIISLNKSNMDTNVLEKFYEKLLEGDNLKTAQSIRNMLNDIPKYLAQRILDQFRLSCSPFEKVWIWGSSSAVFEKAIIDGLYLQMDIECYEDGYNVKFWCPKAGQDEESFNKVVSKIDSLKDFDKKSDASNTIVKHFYFEEKALFAFIKKLLEDLKTYNL